MPPPARLNSCCLGDLTVTLLRTSARRIVDLERPDSLVEQLLEQMLFKTGRRASEAEQRSWRRSLPALAQDLVDAGLGEVEMLVEYHLPPTSQRGLLTRDMIGTVVYSNDAGTRAALRDETFQARTWNRTR